MGGRRTGARHSRRYRSRGAHDLSDDALHALPRNVGRRRRLGGGVPALVAGDKESAAGDGGEFSSEISGAQRSRAGNRRGASGYVYGGKQRAVPGAYGGVLGLSHADKARATRA